MICTNIAIQLGRSPLAEPDKRKYRSLPADRLMIFVHQKFAGLIRETHGAKLARGIRGPSAVIDTAVRKHITA
jgi:hypothetical protein